MKHTRVIPLVFILFFSLILSAEADKSMKEETESRSFQSWLRPGLQFMGLMGYSQTRYWLKYASYIEDWQYHFNWHDQSRRWFTPQAWRFDSNAVSLNWTHALAGCIYYNIARTSGLTQKNAFLFTLAASAYWEYLVEWREVISVNDMIFTPVGGYITGEMWYRMTRAMQNRFKSGARLLNPGLILNPSKRLGDQDKGREWLLKGDFTLNLGTEHRSTLSASRPIQTLAYQCLIKAGDHPDPFGQLRIQTTFSEGALSEFDISCVVPHSLMAYSSQRPPLLTFNWASAFSIYQRTPVAAYDSADYQIHVSPEEMLDIPRNYQDKWASVHMLGPQVHHHLTRGPFCMNSSLSLFADFSLVNALALNEYSRAHDLHTMTSTTFAYGYYYGVGFSAMLNSSLRYHNLNLTTALGYRRAWSINALDRFREDPPLANPGTHDSLFSYEALLSWSPLSWPLALQVRFSGRTRHGEVDKTRMSEKMNTLAAGLALTF